MPATGPWPAYMADYTGGIDVYVDGVKIQQPVRGLNFASGTITSFDADTGILDVTVAGEQGATGPQGATGATGPE